MRKILLVLKLILIQPLIISVFLYLSSLYTKIGSISKYTAFELAVSNLTYAFIALSFYAIACSSRYFLSSFVKIIGLAILISATQIIVSSAPFFGYKMIFWVPILVEILSIYIVKYKLKSKHFPSNDGCGSIVTPFEYDALERLYHLRDTTEDLRMCKALSHLIFMFVNSNSKLAKVNNPFLESEIDILISKLEKRTRDNQYKYEEKRAVVLEIMNELARPSSKMKKL